MSRMSIATPCPAPHAFSSLPVPAPNRRLSTASSQDETAEIDYTRAIQVEFKNAKPRRKSTFQRRDRKEAAITIFEDVMEDQELVVENKRELGGSTLLGRPAQRIPGRAIQRRQDVDLNANQVSHATEQARRRPSIMPAATNWTMENGPHIDLHDATHAVAEEPKMRHGLKKDPRRRTIFVPHDETSIMTIHPGANTTDRLNDTFQLPDLSLQAAAVLRETTGDQEAIAQQQPVRRPRMSLAVAPKRLPLQQVIANESNITSTDIPGPNGGKENVPPNLRHDEQLEEKKIVGPAVAVVKPALARSRLFEPTAASQARQSIVARKAVPFSKTSPNAQRPRPVAKPVTSARSVRDTGTTRNNKHSPASDLASSIGRKPPISKPPPKPVERKVARLPQYPVLSEDLAQPELYEDSWLGHQEIALTELVNEIFSTAVPSNKRWRSTDRSLRECMIDIYHRPSVSTLHKRLNASLLYGALSRPRDALPPPNPAQDIGLRKRFLSLWLDSYDRESLSAAAEVVFGRQLPCRSDINDAVGASERTLDPHKSRRSLISFLETFLVEVEDAESPDEERGDDPHCRWRKMVQRSLMLIWLLDETKNSKVVQRCLFKTTSARKTSVAMLNALAGMMIPSIGDVTRTLHHLDYEVSHVQDPLDEVRYHIDSIAIDLRDGVLLTRLVELLLFDPKRTRSFDPSGDATVTIRMPDLTILESAMYSTVEDTRPRVLSQHLLMPCLGRAQKVYNTEVAISALHDHGRLGDGAADVTAEDIVDGHREKTLSLLWSLVSTRGLEQLFDFREVAADIRTNAGATFDLDSLPGDSEPLSQLQQESLLKKWASVYCARIGIRIGNLTTSFADGSAYAAILEAFATYIPADARPSSSTLSFTAQLEARLRTFGCSSAFIKQLSSTNGTIPSRKTTISNLAFLASRLLPLARHQHAAVKIQRAFRHQRSKVIASQRVCLMRLASSCAAVVQTRNRLIAAATILQRSWRRVLDARIARLNSDVLMFQCVAKGWASRRSVARGKYGRASELSQSMRVMGGW